MPILAYGLNHQTASLDVRERVSSLLLQPDHFLSHLIQKQAANEVVVLSTCNRTEFYAHTADVSQFMDETAGLLQLDASIFQQHAYLHENEQAIKHLVRVATGLDSMVMGEPQIFGQVKTAFDQAKQIGVTGRILERLFQSVFNLTKWIRTETRIGVNPISVAFMAVKIAKQIFSDVSKQTVLLLGAGETIELAATHFVQSGIGRLIIVNRSLENAQVLANKYLGTAIELQRLPEYLSQADIVLAATASDLPLIGKGMVERALKIRKHRPMLMLDLAVPRDIEPQVRQLEDIYLYDMDDLQAWLVENQKHRAAAAEQAETMIDIKSQHLMSELRALDAAELIYAFRQKILLLRDLEVKKAVSRLEKGEEPTAVMHDLARLLTNKILHTPSTQLRQLASEGQLDLMWIVKRLFEL